MNGTTVKDNEAVFYYHEKRDLIVLKLKSTSKMYGLFPALAAQLTTVSLESGQSTAITERDRNSKLSVFFPKRSNVKWWHARNMLLSLMVTFKALSVKVKIHKHSEQLVRNVTDQSPARGGPSHWADPVIRQQMRLASVSSCTTQWHDRSVIQRTWAGLFQVVGFGPETSNWGQSGLGNWGANVVLGELSTGSVCGKGLAPGGR